jgi:hypothetical protein
MPGLAVCLRRGDVQKEALAMIKVPGASEGAMPDSGAVVGLKHMCPEQERLKRTVSSLYGSVPPLSGRETADFEEQIEEARAEEAARIAVRLDDP